MKSRIDSVKLTHSESDGIIVYVCPWCHQGIRKRLDGPVVAAPSLGEGIFHYKCAFEKWASMPKDEVKGKKKA